MLRKLSVLLLGVAVAVLTVNMSNAAVLAEETLEGKITCAKCDLKLEGQKGCATVIVVKKDGKETVYFFDKDAHKKYHSDTCQAAKDGMVKGEVKKDGKKSIVTVKELKYKD